MFTRRSNVDTWPACDSPDLPDIDTMTTAEHLWIWENYHLAGGGNDPALLIALRNHPCVGWWQRRLGELRLQKFCDVHTPWDGGHVPPLTPELREARANAAAAAFDAFNLAQKRSNDFKRVPCPTCGAKKGKPCDIGDAVLPPGMEGHHVERR